MIKKVMRALVLMCLSMVLLSGCMNEKSSYKVGADGTLESHSEVWYDKQKTLEAIQEISQVTGEESPSEQELDSYMMIAGLKIEQEDGRDYYVMSASDLIPEQPASLKEYYQTNQFPETASDLPVNFTLTETSFEEVIITNMKLMDSVYGDLIGGIVGDEENGAEINTSTYEIMQKYLKDSMAFLSITFATPIAKVSEGAALSDDKKTVSFSVSADDDGKEIYAYCENDIPFDGVKSGIVYGRTVHYTIPDGIEATLDGSRVEGDVSSEKSGKHELRLKAPDGTQKSFYYGVDKEGPAVSGIKNNGIYTGSKKITIFDAVSDIDTVTMDGKDIFSELEPVIEDAASLNNLKYTYPIKSLKDGKHTLVATDELGNKSSVTFLVDKTAPKITGVKNNKIYKKAVTIKVSDKNGVKSITLNGKKIKTGKKVSKKGSYTVIAKDKAGNKTTVKFKIKK